jgi:molecular chaperone GrpE
MREQLAEQKDLNLRMAADFENFKRRSRPESDARAVAQKESFIHDLLPAIDNLERALAAGAAPGSPELHKGVEMTTRRTHRNFLDWGAITSIPNECTYH